jgi:type IV secretory pathway VirB3-like protein
LEKSQAAGIIDSVILIEMVKDIILDLIVAMVVVVATAVVAHDYFFQPIEMARIDFDLS